MRMMRKYIDAFRYFRILPAICAVLFLCGCQGEPEGPIEMTFRAFNGSGTRAGQPTEALGADYTIWASAIYRYSDQDTPYYYFGPSLKKLDYRDDCFVATNYFYPLTGSMKMVAYAGNSPSGTLPGVSLSLLPTTAASNTFTSLTIDLSSSSYNGTYEVVYSDPVTLDCTAVSTTPAQLHFHHTQANIRFEFKAADAETCRQVKFNYITIEGVAWNGKYVIDYSNSTHQWTQKSTPASTKVANFPNVSNGQIPSVTEPLTAGNGLYICPQATRTRIIVNYTMLNVEKAASAPTRTYVENYGDGQGGNDDKERTMNYVVNESDASAGWQEGYQYTYYILVKGSQQMEVTGLKVEEVQDGTTGNLRI